MDKLWVRKMIVRRQGGKKMDWTGCRSEKGEPGCRAERELKDRLQKEDKQSAGQKRTWTGCRAERGIDRMQGRKKIERIKTEKSKDKAAERG